MSITIFEQSLYPRKELDPILTEVFEEAARLENLFSIFSAESEIKNLHSLEPGPAASPEVRSLLLRARSFWEKSNGYFYPFRQKSDGNLSLDLNGIAKGDIVDRMAQLLIEKAPGISGILNAGGDGCFFGESEKSVQLRMGTLQNPLIRDWKIPMRAFATSSPQVSIHDSLSTTRYERPLRPELGENFCVAVSAPDCATADAMTKVGLMAPLETLRKCAQENQAQVLVFDSSGLLREELSAL